MLSVGHFGQETVGGQQGVTLLNRIIYYATLWLLYFGRPLESSENSLLWLGIKAVLMLDWGSSTLDITTAGIVGISHCLCGFGYCTVLMLAVLTDGRWKHAVTYCNIIRCWHDVVDRTSTFYTLQNARHQRCKRHSDSGQQMSSLPDIVPEVPAVCLLQTGVLFCHTQGCVER